MTLEGGQPLATLATAWRLNYW